MTTEPPDAATWEYSAVAYVSIALTLLIATHVYFECTGFLAIGSNLFPHPLPETVVFS